MYDLRGRFSWFLCRSSILVKLEFGVLVFVERGKPEYPEKKPWSKARTNNKLNPHVVLGQNQTRATLVGGGLSHHCAMYPCSPNPVPSESQRFHLCPTCTWMLVR